MKEPIKCKIRLHGSYKEIVVGPFISITKAKEWLICWNRPYTIVRETERLYNHLPIKI